METTNNQNQNSKESLMQNMRNLLMGIVNFAEKPVSSAYSIAEILNLNLPEVKKQLELTFLRLERNLCVNCAVQQKGKTNKGLVCEVCKNEISQTFCRRGPESKCPSGDVNTNHTHWDCGCSHIVMKGIVRFVQSRFS